MKMIRKTAVQVGAFALLVFIAWNAYLAVNHLRQTQKIAALTLESSTIQGDIAGVLKDLTDMETGSARISADRGHGILAALHGCEGQDRKRLCQPSFGPRESRRT